MELHLKLHVFRVQGLGVTGLGCRYSIYVGLKPTCIGTPFRPKYMLYEFMES